MELITYCKTLKGVNKMNKQEQMLICAYEGKAENGGIMLNVWKEEDEPVLVRIDGIRNKKLKIAVDSVVKEALVVRVVRDFLSYSNVLGIHTVELQYDGLNYRIRKHASKGEQSCE